MKYSVLSGKNVQEKIKTLPEGLNYPIVLKRELETCVRIVETLLIVGIHLAWAKAPLFLSLESEREKFMGKSGVNIFSNRKIISTNP